MKRYRSASEICLTVLVAALAACGGGGGGSPASTTPTANALTVTGTAATGLAIPGATVTGKCKIGAGTATTAAGGTYTLTITDGELPCVLQITNPIDGIKLDTVVTGAGNTATANITPLTEMATARVLGSEPNVFFAAFNAAIATQKITSTTVQAALTDVGLVLTGTVDTTALGNFISAPLKAATQSSPTSGDVQDKLLDALKLKLTSGQIGALTTALASNQTTDAIKQTVASMTATPTTPPVANAGAAQSVVTGTTVTLDASTSSAATGKTLTYAWTLISKPAGSATTLAASTTAKPTFVADVAGLYVASVIVHDGTTASSASAVTVTASVTNAAPVANAGVAQNVVASSVVTLDGSASSDANSNPLTYAWTLTSKPAGSAAALSSTTSAKPTFTADVAGTYVASLTVNDGKVNSMNVATVSVTANIVGTSVSGMVATSTVWTKANSPYLMTGNVLIPGGVTLSIDAGVEVRGSSFQIQTEGTLNVTGTSSDPVVLTNVAVIPAGKQTSNHLIRIVGASITGGSVYAPTGNAIYGTLVLTDSQISNTSNGSYFYLWYPLGVNVIERNVFTNTGGISYGIDARSAAVSLSIKNNKFIAWTGDAAIKNWAMYGSNVATVQLNSFLSTDRVAVMLPSGYTSVALDATNNYWGTTSSSVINSMIYDRNDDLNSGGFVSYAPFLTTPDAGTP